MSNKLREWSKPFYGVSHWQTEHHLATINEYSVSVDARVQVWPAQSFINFAGEKTFYGETRMEDAKRWAQSFIERLEGVAFESDDAPMGGGSPAAAIVFDVPEARVIPVEAFTGLAAPTPRPMPMARISPCDITLDVAYTLAGERRTERKHIVVSGYFVSGGEVFTQGTINGAPFTMRETKLLTLIKQTTLVYTNAAHS